MYLTYQSYVKFKLGAESNILAFFITNLFSLRQIIYCLSLVVIILSAQVFGSPLTVPTDLMNGNGPDGVLGTADDVIVKGGCGKC